MRIFSRSTLRSFWEQSGRHDAEQPLKAWFQEVERPRWANAADIKALYASASIIGGSRVVFNFGGNKYRLIVVVNYAYQKVFIRFIGTHAEYDKINALEV